jgi:hypothetical protein
LAQPGEALRVSELDEVQRAVISDWLREEGATAVGISDPVPGGWATEDYARWWWLFTPEHVALLLRMAGFEVRRSAPAWNGRATIVEAATAPGDE